jgi:hypothetical protein
MSSTPPDSRPFSSRFSPIRRAVRNRSGPPLGPPTRALKLGRRQPEELLVMPGKRAKAVTPEMLRRMLFKASKSPFRARDRAMILLSVKAGLRACEIARLDWSMVLDARGKVADVLAIRDAIAKKRGGRRIPSRPAPRASRIAALQRAVGTSHSLRPRRPLAAHQRGQLVRGPVQGTRLRGVLVALRPTHPSSPGPRATSTVAVAACATCSCLLGTGRSRRPSATSTATRAGRGAWSACCDPRPISDFHLKG